MKRWGVALLVLVAAAIGVGWWLGRSVEVEVVRATSRAVVETLVVTGRVRPVAEVTVASMRGGRLVELPVREGDRVEPGALIARLEDPGLVVDLSRREAARDQAVARLRQIESTQVRVALRDVDRAALDVASARRDVERLEGQVAAGLATGLALEDARSRLQGAEIAEQRARSVLSGLRGGPEGAAALAAVRAAEADVEAARVALAETVVRAPAAGTIVERHREPGEVVTPGGPLVRLAVDGAPELVAQPDERELARLRVGQSATVVADALPNATFRATLDRIFPAIDPSRGTVEIRLVPEAPPAALRPDMTVSIEIETGRREATPVLPASAVMDGADGAPRVRVVEDGVVQEREVRLGLRTPAWVEVVDWPAASLVVVDPRGAKGGSRVTPKERRAD